MSQRNPQNPGNERVACITGASQGLGLALAEALAERGWTLVIDARRADRLEPAASALAEHTSVASIPVTSPTPRTAPNSSSGAGAGPARSPRQQREHAGREPVAVARHHRSRPAAAHATK